MSVLALRAIEEAGLGDVLRARQAQDLSPMASFVPRLERADLLVLGALADRIRADEVGSAVRVFAGVRPDVGPLVMSIDAEGLEGARKADVLRRVATARIVGPRAARVRVDWTWVGIELAQVALGFGANELSGPVLNRRGLPIADESTKKVKGAGLVSSQLLKKQELFALIRSAGREPVEARPSPGLTSNEGGKAAQKSEEIREESAP